MADADTRRGNQKRRTRKALLEAATRLMREGRKPGFDEVAEAALVSRATAYRYFSGIDALLVEAGLDLAMPGEDFFAEDPSKDPADRLLRAEAAVAAMIRDNEAAIRTMLIHSLQQSLAGEGSNGDLPARQNRRTPLIQSALTPLRGRLSPEAYERLARAMALVVGTEAMLVFKDVLQLDEAEAHEVKKWVIGALIEKALADG